jgi:hypothetical protein
MSLQQALRAVVDILQGAGGPGQSSPRVRLAGAWTRQLQQAIATREGKECKAGGLTDEPWVVRGQGRAVGITALLTGVWASERPCRHPVEAELGPAQRAVQQEQRS